MAFRGFRATAILCLALSVSACGISNPFRQSDEPASQATERSGGFLRTTEGTENSAQRVARERRETIDPGRQEQSLLGDLFVQSADPNTSIRVNKYIWAASLDVLDFLPIEQVDPFSGIIVTGFGTAPGANQSYRATIFVRDPALEARSLNLALVTRSGPASQETILAVEDAILTRARQLRLADLDL